MVNHTINTAAGTVLAVVTVPTPTIQSTIVIAIIGAATSFLTSVVLKEVWKEFLTWKNKKNEKDGTSKNN